MIIMPRYKCEQPLFHGHAQTHCLFCDTDSTQGKFLDSVLLPSYKISADSKYKKDFGFKAEHDNTKTLYFAADHQDSLNNWIVGMRMAANANVQKDFDGHG